MNLPPIGESACVFSPDRKYRYSLRRIWRPSGPVCLYIMLNPSTADEQWNDPTVHRCQGRAVAAGFGGFEVCNLFAWRSTDPRVLSRLADPIGDANDFTISAAVRHADLVICGWGKEGRLLGRGAAVLGLIEREGRMPHALAINKNGTPSHPLYLKLSLEPFPIGRVRP